MHISLSDAELCDVLGNRQTSILSDYDVLGRIGEGAQGEVYLGRRLSTGQVVAIKKIRKTYQVFPHRL